MRFIGLDLHKKVLVVCALDRRGKVLFRESVECRREVLLAFAKAKLQKSDQLAVEATTNTWAVADILRPFAGAVRGRSGRLEPATIRSTISTASMGCPPVSRRWSGVPANGEPWRWRR